MTVMLQSKKKRNWECRKEFAVPLNRGEFLKRKLGIVANVYCKFKGNNIKKNNSGSINNRVKSGVRSNAKLKPEK